jgi:hypothetical protein
MKTIDKNENIEDLKLEEFGSNKHADGIGAKNIKIETVKDLKTFFHACPDHSVYIDAELYRKIKLFNMPVGNHLNVSNAGMDVIKVTYKPPNYSDNREVSIFDL